MNGVFYGIEGMRAGGWRKFKVGPHLMYGNKGHSDIIPPDAVLTILIRIDEIVYTKSSQQGGQPDAFGAGCL